MTTYVLKTTSSFNPQIKTFKNIDELFQYALEELINDKSNSNLSVLDFILKISDMAIKSAIEVKQ